MIKKTRALLLIASLASAAGYLHAESQSTYVLGPEDLISIRILEAQDIADKPLRIDSRGYIELPLAGRCLAGGLTVEQLQQELSSRLKTYIRDPHISITIEESRSQPVSVIGAVTTPGLHQLQGQKTLTEVLAMAGGVRPDAGHTVKITRRLEWGKVPLPSAADDATGQFSVAEVDLTSIIAARNPEHNVVIRPHDVVSVPSAEIVYVVGEVAKSGGFPLNDRETLSVLQSLSLAGGLRTAAAPQNARILRPVAGSADRTEIPVDLRRVLQGKGTDTKLQAGDILFVPDNAPKKAGIRAIEAAIQLGTGMVIWRR